MKSSHQIKSKKYEWHYICLKKYISPGYDFDAIENNVSGEDLVPKPTDETEKTNEGGSDPAWATRQSSEQQQQLAQPERASGASRGLSLSPLVRPRARFLLLARTLSPVSLFPSQKLRFWPGIDARSPSAPLSYNLYTNHASFMKYGKWHRGIKYTHT